MEQPLPTNKTQARLLVNSPACWHQIFGSVLTHSHNACSSTAKTSVLRIFFKAKYAVEVVYCSVYYGQQIF